MFDQPRTNFGMENPQSSFFGGEWGKEGRGGKGGKEGGGGRGKEKRRGEEKRKRRGEEKRKGGGGGSGSGGRGRSPTNSCKVFNSRVKLPNSRSMTDTQAMHGCGKSDLACLPAENAMFHVQCSPDIFLRP